MTPHALHTVLVLRLSSIGDIILTTPFLRAFKRRHPDCALHYVVRIEYAELLRDNPFIDRLITVDVTEGRRGLEALNLSLNAVHYNAVFDLHNHLRTRIVRNGLSANMHHVNKRSLRRLLLVGLHANFYGPVVPVSERYIETAARYGVHADADGPELFLSSETRHAVEQRFRLDGVDSSRALLGLCPGARHFTKRWPRERYAALAGALVERGQQVLLFGAKEDAGLRDALPAHVRPAVFEYCGEFSLLETAAAMEHCTAVVANDSGLMHLATAVRRPVVALFGSTVREFGFFPYNSPASVLEVQDLACRPCTFIGRASCPRGHFRCMRAIDVPDVLDALDMLTAAVAP